MAQRCSDLEPLPIPPNSDLSKQWRSTLLINGFPIPDEGSNGELVVTAAENAGECHGDLWPAHVFVQPSRVGPVLSRVHDWVRKNNVPFCTFTPDQLQDPRRSDINKALYLALSRLLFENHTVAFAPWYRPNRLPGVGIIVYPELSCGARLFGAICLTSSFSGLSAYSIEHLSTAPQNRPCPFRPRAGSPPPPPATDRLFKHGSRVSGIDASPMHVSPIPPGHSELSMNHSPVVVPTRPPYATGCLSGCSSPPDHRRNQRSSHADRKGHPSFVPPSCREATTSRRLNPRNSSNLDPCAWDTILLAKHERLVARA